jgi:16S rRNA (uracil1498-N3)-methyltransferase
MTRRRWIADEVHADRALLLGQNAQHLVRVLRAQIGHEFDVAADGQVRAGKIVSISDNRVEFELGEAVIAGAALDLTLLISVFKFDRMEWAIEKTTELGVARIVPIIARRTDSHLAKAADKRVERWRRIAKEAAQQSRRQDVPEIADSEKLVEAIKKNSGTRMLLAETEQEKTLKSQLQNVSQPVTLAFGPEGGWTEDEIRQFEETGWAMATLGATILRAETAIIAAVAIAVSELSSTS